jgi:hypothetical protein
MSNDAASPAVRLAAILSEENAALAALDFPRAVALLPAKTLAAEAVLAAPDATAAPLLAPLAEENRRLLQHAMSVQGRVIEIIARAIPRALQQTGACYGAQGKVPCPRMPAISVSARA